MQQQIQAGSPPDVAIINAAAVYTLTDSRVDPAPGRPDPEERRRQLIKDFFPALMNSQLGGKTWSIPFQRAPSSPTTTKTCSRRPASTQHAAQELDRGGGLWQEADEKDTSGKVSVYGAGFPSDGSSYWEFQALAIEAGQNVFKNDAGNVVYFNAPADH